MATLTNESKTCLRAARGNPFVLDILSYEISQELTITLHWLEQYVQQICISISSLLLYRACRSWQHVANDLPVMGYPAPRGQLLSPLTLESSILSLRLQISRTSEYKYTLGDNPDRQFGLESLERFAHKKLLLRPCASSPLHVFRVLVFTASTTLPPPPRQSFAFISSRCHTHGRCMVKWQAKPS